MPAAPPRGSRRIRSPHRDATGGAGFAAVRADPDPRFQAARFSSRAALLDVARVESLLTKDASLATKPDANGFTPLHYVAGSRMYLESEKLAAGQLRLARRLIDAAPA